ncbi:glycoside hydrolase family 79 protein [Pholiota molesta]|nr:glycoside hydrolase family 79 protein [Pholiota molesta]
MARCSKPSPRDGLSERFLLSSWLCLSVVADAIQISIPSSLSSSHVVQQNFLGISFELSFLDYYFGNDTSTIPPTMVNYLTALRSRTDNNPLRMRIGGNSLDSSTYDSSLASPMIQITSGPVNANDQPVTYGPVLWDVLDKVSSDIGGAYYLIGLSLEDPNSTNVPLVAGAATDKLGETLDAFLLGNEPDLYTGRLKPNVQNYTTTIYMDEFQEVLDHLNTTSAGNILDKPDIGGPTICCQWDLGALLDEGYTSRFGTDLKYISLQHYPQNFCSGTSKVGISYYTTHSNVVGLAAWQSPGIGKVLSSQGSNQQEVIMSEFNSASCGGIPIIRRIQRGLYHTRERGITYNLFTPPIGPNGGPGPWTTNPTFYSLLVTAEALHSTKGAIVVDLNVEGSKSTANAAVSGYAIYDASDSAIHQLVLFNYANTTSSTSATASFTIPANTFPSNTSNAVTVKYLSGDSLSEVENIAWGGQTYAGVGDGNLIAANASWAPPNSQIDCTNGCTINVPSPGMAVVFGGGMSPAQPTPGLPSKTGISNSNGTSSAKAKSGTKTILPDLSLCATFIAWVIIQCSAILL